MRLQRSLAKSARMEKTEMHFVTCMIALGGDIRNVLPRTEFSPVSWPELDIIRSIHGDDSVTDIKPFVKVEQTAKQEKERLMHIYGAAVVENTFPGKNPQMELEMAGAKLPAQIPVWLNPILKDPAAFGHKDTTIAATAKPAKSGVQLPFNEG